MSIITSMLDTDFYKFTMQQCVFHRFTDTDVEYDFKLRNYSHHILVPYKDEIEEEIAHLCTVRVKPEELAYLPTIRFFKKGYIAFLRNFKLHQDNITVFEDKNGLQIKIRGTWLNTILFETPVLAIVSEVYNRNNYDIDKHEGEERLWNKILAVRDYTSYNPSGISFRFVDFGTRRRFTKAWHETVIRTFAEELPAQFIGTSNVYFAWKNKIKAMGTMAHEYVSAMQGMPDKCGLKYSQKFAFENWVQEYRGDLGIALSDTLGFTAFLDDFDCYFAKLFDGARHDSGDPYDWCKRLIAHYKKFRINPMTKSAVFSDGLTIPKAIDIHRTFHNQIQISFGIGTNLTNDVGCTPLNIVIKMIKCNSSPVAKISDSHGKQMCTDINYLQHLARVFNIPQERVEKII